MQSNHPARQVSAVGLPQLVARSLCLSLFSPHKVGVHFLHFKKDTLGNPDVMDVSMLASSSKVCVVVLTENWPSLRVDSWHSETRIGWL